MADSKITQLPVITSAAGTALLPIVSPPSGTPVTNQITKANFYGGTNVSQVVGTTETQTITGKTFTSPKINENVALTATATQLNYSVGVTSAIQTQLDAKASLISPSFTTPTLGVATATSINKVTITAPASSATLTIANGKTLTVSNTLTLAGTDSTVMTFPSTTDTVVTLTATQVLTNKTMIATTNVIQEITTIADSATPTPTGGSLRNAFTVTALGQSATFAAPSGTPVNLNTLIIRVLDNGTARALAFNAIYRFSTDLAAPTTTVLSKTLYMGFIYNSAASKWDCIAIVNNF